MGTKLKAWLQRRQLERQANARIINQASVHHDFACHLDDEWPPCGICSAVDDLYAVTSPHPRHVGEKERK